MLELGFCQRHVEVYHVLYIRKVDASSQEISGQDHLDLHEAHLLKGLDPVLLTLVSMEVHRGHPQLLP